MITDYNTIIIGAGTAGLFAGSLLKKGKTLIIEKNTTCGRKLLISGAGQCNYTHAGDLDEMLTKYGDNGSFLRPSLYNFSNKSAMQYFKDMNVDSIVREDGKVFPSTFKASDVQQNLINKIKQNNTEILYNTSVLDVKYNNETKAFTVKTEKQKYTTQNVIISTGGKSYPNTGSTGDGYKFAKELGHKIVDVYPCLTPVNVYNYEFSDLSGVSFSGISMSIWRNNKKLRDVFGDLLLTHKNFSGPLVLNNSRYIRTGDKIKINFISMSKDELRALIEKETKNNGKQLVKSIFKETKLTKRFIEKIFSLLAIDEQIACNQLKKNDKNLLINSLTEYEKEVESLGNFNMAMATTGGVDLKQINRKTCESKLISGLYFVGEVMDIDGETGGYNIQAAFSTAALAVKNISSKSI